MTWEGLRYEAYSPLSIIWAAHIIERRLLWPKPAHIIECPYYRGVKIPFFGRFAAEITSHCHVSGRFAAEHLLISSNFRPLCSLPILSSLGRSVLATGGAHIIECPYNRERSVHGGAHGIGDANVCFQSGNCTQMTLSENFPAHRVCCVFPMVKRKLFGCLDF